MIQDYFRFSFESIKKRKLRSYLTLIGIFIGIAAVVSLISLGQGLQAAISEQFQAAGANKIFVMPGSGFGPPGSSVDKLTEHDRDVVEGTRGVEGVSAIIFKFGNVNFNDKTVFVPLNGYPTDSEGLAIASEAQALKIVSGRNIKNGDKNKAVMGYSYYVDDSKFGKIVKVRDTVQIEGENFEVVGLADKIGNPSDDSNVYIPLETAQDLFDAENQFDFIFVQVEDGKDVDEVAEAIKEEMRDDRGEEKGEESFGVQTFESILTTFNSIFGIVQAVIIGIAAISLVVGGIGIMNTMYMSVLERTKEIGVMKAIGAKNSDIMTIFLIESGFYGLIGGAIGIAIGIGIGKGTEFIASQFLGTGLLRAVISPTLVLSVLAFSFFIGILSGAAPAYRASKLKPVDALRYE